MADVGCIVFTSCPLPFRASNASAPNRREHATGQVRSLCGNRELTLTKWLRCDHSGGGAASGDGLITVAKLIGPLPRSNFAGVISSSPGMQPLLSVRPETLFGFLRPSGEPDGRRSSEDNAGRILRSCNEPDGRQMALKRRRKFLDGH